MQRDQSLLAKKQADVCVVGMGYVGLTLAAALVQRGKQVLGHETNEEIGGLLGWGKLHLFEPSVAEVLREHLGRSLSITSQLPEVLPPVVVVCVGTPLRPHTNEPDLRQVEGAVAAIAERMSPDTLVVLRSTVPVGTCRTRVLPLLRRRVPTPLLAFCPERTIQGKALEELGVLPQIVGGLDERAVQRATTLFKVIAPEVVPVSSLEAAEMVKLIGNCHTDLIYGYGNEVALMAEALGLDSSELIRAANLNYPRPDLCKPGFVGGSCLSKDPYFLIHSVAPHGYTPRMVAAARQLNESVPHRVGERVLATLQELGCDPTKAKILITGFAYKGRPETDDLRGAPFGPILDLFRTRVRQVVGHDFVVAPHRIASLGVEPVTLEEGFTGANAAVILNNHRLYQAQDLHALVQRMQRPAVLYDAWGVFQAQMGGIDDGVCSLGLGHG